MKNFKLYNNIVGWLAFAIATVTYLLTIEPTASFWDCGEFIASAFKLEVGHPPGAPFFMMTGRLFSMLASDPTQVAAMVNAMLPEDTTYDEYMAMSFAMLDMCDCVFMLDGWEKSKGAKMEFERAVKNGLNIIYQTMPEWQQKIYNTFVASY